MTKRLVTSLLFSMLSIAFGFDAIAQEYVAIPGDAWLRADPASNAIQYRKGGDYLQYGRVLAEQDGWLKVALERTDDRQGHCVVAYQLYPVRIDMWVREKEVVPVTTKSVSWKADDGTWVSLRPGVPVRKMRNGYETRTEPAWRLEIDQKSVGARYQPVKAPRLDTEYRKVRGSISVAGRKLSNTDGKWMSVVREVEADGKRRFEITSGCVRALVDGNLERPEPSGEAGILGALTGGAFMQGKYRVVEPGATVYFADGKRAGEVEQNWNIYEWTDRDDRICATVADYAESGGLELCVATKDTVEKETEGIGPGFALGSLGTGKTVAGLGALEEPAAKSTLSKEDVQKTIHRSRNDVQRCFALGLQGRPGLEGKLVASMQVRADGTVKDVRFVENTLKHDRVEKCMLDLLKGLKFPAAKGREISTVKYPFIFKADE